MTDIFDNNLDVYVQKILDSYHTDDATQRIGKIFLPSHGRIVEILKDIRVLLFPGFFGHKRLRMDSIAATISANLTKIYQGLIEEVTHCLCSHSQCPAERCVDCSDTETQALRQRAGEIVGDFFDQIPHIRNQLSLDVLAAIEGDPAAKSIDEVIYCYPGFYAVVIFRISHKLHQLGVPLMPRIMSEYAHSLTGADIHPGAKIGASFFIDHATGVVIGETTIIGDNVKIYQGVTLGATSFPRDKSGNIIKGLKRHPTLEDNVTVYANATILGGSTCIGNGVTVAGNTFVTESISADSLVAHEQPKLNVRAKNQQKP